MLGSADGNLQWQINDNMPSKLKIFFFSLAYLKKKNHQSVFQSFLFYSQQRILPVSSSVHSSNPQIIAAVSIQLCVEGLC